jgi:putative nucleotidyltransferase with HDIG domain
MRFFSTVRTMSQAPNTQEIKTRKVELVLQQLDSLPTLPAIVIRLLALTNDSEAHIQEVVQLLSADQSLTSKLLSLAGSAAAGVRVPVTNVQQAVVLLGFETVRNLALSVKVFESFQQSAPADTGQPAPLFKREEFWKHSLAVATAAEMLAQKTRPRINPADAFVCGLLHDMGKVAFDTVMPKSFARVVEMATLTRGDIADLERRVIGIDHTLAGKRLAEAWNLPPIITQAIWFHGNAPPPPPAPGSPPLQSAPGGNGMMMPLVLLVGLADLLVRRQHIGFSGNFLFPYDVDQYAVHLGLSLDAIDEITAQLAGALEQRARAIGLYDVDSRQLYLESIANANLELGRLNHQYRVQNQLLTTRSKCFEMLTRFYQRIVPAASPAQLLAEIAQVAHPVLESPRLVLFSQDPTQAAADGEERGRGGGVGEVLLFDPARAVHDSFLMPMPVYGGDQRVGRANRNFMRPASPQVDWLLERVRAFLGLGAAAQGDAPAPGTPWFMPLLCGNEPVGGIVWLAREGSANPLSGVADMELVSQSWGMTLRTAQLREQQMVLTESLAAANRELGAMQQQRVREKSLASLGEMAAGAAHEMNNPLSVISGRAQLLAAKISDAGMKNEAGLIAAQAERLSQIITDMRDFAKPVSPRMDAVDINALAAEAVQAATQRADQAGCAAVPVRLEPASEPPAVRADNRQIRGALAEIIVNAMQATHAARVEAAAHGRAAPTQDDVVVSVNVDPLDQQIIIQVRDAGIGMSQDVVRNAFAPFFSAKSAGRNRGMGLAKALRWVENHGGTIRLDSTFGQGTTAVVILPLNATAPAAEPAPAPAPAPARAPASRNP